MPRYLLVIEVPHPAPDDIGRLAEAGERIDALLRDLGRLDDPDASAREGKLLIRTETPEKAFQKALPCLDEPLRERVRAAYREHDGETYTVLWPPTPK